MQTRQPNDIAVIAPNFKRRVSGVTATVVHLVPMQARKIGIVATGPGLPADVPHWSLSKVLWHGWNRTRVWHARRNNELLFGLFLRDVMRMPFKVVFTSSSPRVRGGLTRWMTGRCDAIIATNALNAAVMPGQVQVIPHGVDPWIFTATEAMIFGQHGQNLIGCFGRVRPMKGTHHFVAAMCQLLPDRPNWSAVILGRATGKHAEYKSELVARIAANGLSDRILFVDEIPVKQMPAAYQSLSLYVAPSLLEGFGLTVPEAMSCGVPVVASDVGAFQQIVTSETGRVVPADDGPALTAAIAQILGTDLELAGTRARNHILANHSLSKEAFALVTCYEGLIAQKSA